MWLVRKVGLSDDGLVDEVEWLPGCERSDEDGGCCAETDEASEAKAACEVGVFGTLDEEEFRGFGQRWAAAAAGQGIAYGW